MKRIAIAVLLLVLSDRSAGLSADEPARMPSRTDELVAASKAAKAKKKKSTSKVITNADVKKSKGKLIENGTLPPLDETPAPGMVEQHEAAKKARHANAEKIAVLEKTVAALEAELTAVERDYFEENDANVRDRVVVQLFTGTKARLDTARQELAALISPPAP